MQSLLTNIWRENSAYLRYGDAKCVVLFGLSGAAISSFVFHLTRVQGFDHSMFRNLQLANISMPQWIALGFLFVSFIIAVIGATPVYSKRPIRVDLSISVGRLIGAIGAEGDVSRLIYYIDIASFDELSAYRAASEPAAGMDSELVDQIWIVSRIAAAKHVLTLASGSALTTGFVLSIFVG